MKNVKMPTSRSYQEYLISSLKDPERAIGYISVALELDEEGREPELLRAMLKDVIDARVLSNNLSETAIRLDNVKPQQIAVLYSNTDKLALFLVALPTASVWCCRWEQAIARLRVGQPIDPVFNDLSYRLFLGSGV